MTIAIQRERDKRTEVSKLKIVDSIYFYFFSHFYFYLFYFLDLGLGFSMMS